MRIRWAISMFVYICFVINVASSAAQTPEKPAQGKENPSGTPAPPQAPTPTPAAGSPAGNPNPTKVITDNLAAQDKESEFSLVIGVGSLILAPGVTDYQNQANVLTATHLGKATPQLLTGVSFRTKIPTPFTRFRCDGKEFSRQMELYNGTANAPKANCETHENGKLVPGIKRGDLWQRNPWSAFASLKFAPGASNPINGFVFGGSFSITHYMDFLVGFALSPVNEPSPGFRTVAAQFVQMEQQQGRYMNFNPTAMLNNSQFAFDGFPTTNPTTGALIYPGNPLTTHYRGGVMIGIAIPISFSSYLKGSAPASPNATSGAK